MSFLSDSIEIYTIASNYQRACKPSDQTIDEIVSLLQEMEICMSSIEETNNRISKKNDSNAFTDNNSFFLDFQASVRNVKLALFTAACFLEIKGTIDIHPSTTNHSKPQQTSDYLRTVFSESIRFAYMYKPCKKNTNKPQYTIANAVQSEKSLIDTINKIETINALILSNTSHTPDAFQSHLFDLAACYYSFEKLVYIVVAMSY